MQDKTYDIGVIGAGVAGVFATHRLLKNAKKNIEIALFDIGRPAQKRRVQMYGFAGLLPFSDGKLYMQDNMKVEALTGKRKVSTTYQYIFSLLKDLDKDLKITHDKNPSVSVLKTLTKNNFSHYLNDYIQLYPKQIHNLCRVFAKEFETARNLTSYFDTEIEQITKEKGYFVLSNEDGQEFRCKKIILAAGRAGWRWAAKVFKDFDIIENNDEAKFGIRAELDTLALKDFNHSNLTIMKDDLEIGPFSWMGTVLPEDHLDMAISAFRSNEGRWKTDKVSFNIIGNRIFKDFGVEQVNRVANLTFILTNERISKEKISTFLNKRSKVSIMRDYDWLVEALTTISTILPDLNTKGYFHVPTIIPLAPKIKLDNQLGSTKLSNLYCAGESAGITGLWSAMLSGIIVADGVLNGY